MKLVSGARLKQYRHQCYDHSITQSVFLSSAQIMDLSSESSALGPKILMLVEYIASKVSECTLGFGYVLSTNRTVMQCMQMCKHAGGYKKT